MISWQTTVFPFSFSKIDTPLPRTTPAVAPDLQYFADEAEFFVVLCVLAKRFLPQ